MRAAAVDGSGCTPERQGRHQGPAPHQEEHRCDRVHKGPAPREPGRGQHTEQEIEHHLQCPEIAAAAERLETESLGVLLRHAPHQRRQRLLGGQREWEGAREEEAEEKMNPAQVLGARPQEVCPQAGQFVGLRWPQGERVGREDPADGVNMKAVHGTLSRTGRVTVFDSRPPRVFAVATPDMAARVHSGERVALVWSGRRRLSIGRLFDYGAPYDVDVSFSSPLRRALNHRGPASTARPPQFDL